MVQIFECGSVVPGCKLVIHGEVRDDVLVKAIEHLHALHDIEHLSEQLKARVRAVIRDEAVAELSGGDMHR